MGIAERYYERKPKLVTKKYCFSCKYYDSRDKSCLLENKIDCDFLSCPEYETRPETEEQYYYKKYQNGLKEIARLQKKIQELEREKCIHYDVIANTKWCEYKGYILTDKYLTIPKMLPLPKGQKLISPLEYFKALWTKNEV